MRLKRYFQFIKESVVDDIKEQKLWELDPDDILEFFMDFEDEGYDVTIELGFEEKYEDYSEGEKERFTTKLLTGDIVPSYWIEIQTTDKTSSEDLTDSLKFAVDMIADKLNTKEQLSLFPTPHKDYPGKITIVDSIGNDQGDEYNIDLLYNDKIIIKGDTYIKDEELDNNICLFIRQKDSVKITPKEMFDYYEWGYDYVDDKGNIYADIDIEDMSDLLLNRNDNYKDVLVGGTENMWDWYETGNYVSDDISFFQYTLDKENEVLMVKSIIKEMGGLEEVKYHIGNECDDEVIEATKNMSEDELVKFLLEERFYSTLKEISDNSEIKSEIKYLAADWEMGAHVVDNYKSILSEFDRIVGEEFEFKRIEKEVEKSYTSTDSEGNKKIHKYKQEVIYYRIPFDEKWLSVIEDWDYDDMKNHINNIEGLVHEYGGQEYFNYTMSPNMHDWGNVDSKALNEDIKHYLTRFISN